MKNSRALYPAEKCYCHCKISCHEDVSLVFTVEGTSKVPFIGITESTISQQYIVQSSPISLLYFSKMNLGVIYPRMNQFYLRESNTHGNFFPLIKVQVSMLVFPLKIISVMDFG